MAGDSFLSDPSRKRKRAGKATSTTRSNIDRSRSNKNHSSKHDEEISSGSDSEDDSRKRRAGAEDEYDEENPSSDDEFADENEADKRRRLAKQYLDNLKENELTGGDEDFDAGEMDDDILSRRLQNDVAEDRGFIYKFIGDKIASQIDDSVHLSTTRIGSKNLTAVVARYPYLFTVSKDIELIKWNIATKKPTRIKHTRGGASFTQLRTNPQLNHHWDQINCVAASPDGKYVVTGGSDARLIIWSSENLTCLKVLETRSPVNAITFRRNTDQLYAACADLKIRTYSINQFAQLEILYGHQDNISDISSLGRETCVSVGSRDKTAMFWKIAEESRLTFRGGDSSEKKHKKKKHTEEPKSDPALQKEEEELPFHAEGSIEVVSMVDESHFVTGSDNGNIALWSLAKKKPLFVQRLAHGLQPGFSPAQASAEVNEKDAKRQVPDRQPYWITSIHAIPYSDVFVSGSFGGSLKVWRLGREGLRSFELIGEITNVRGVVVGIDDVEIKDDKKVVVHALISKEHKFGRWLGKLEGARNALVSFSFDI